MKALFILLFSLIFWSQCGNTIRLPSPISIVYWNSKNRQLWKNEMQRENYEVISNENTDPILEAIKNKVLEKLEEFLYNEIQERRKMRFPTWRQQTLRLIPWRTNKRFTYPNIPHIWTSLRLY